ncbi:hypothetical protein AB3S75_015933 [Citrus x aurantiifolia]
MEEASSPSRREANDQTNVCNCKNKNEDEITMTEPKISKQTEGAQSSIDDQGEDEYYARYWPLYKMIQKNDWRGVEDFITSDPDALTAKIVAPGSTTIFHAIVESLVDVVEKSKNCLPISKEKLVGLPNSKK